MRAIESLLVVLVVLAFGYGTYRLARWYFRRPPVVATTSAWETRYTIDGTQTVWLIYRDVTGSNGNRQRESQQIRRIDSAAADFDELFLQGEQLAQQRAFLLNSSLTP